MTVIYLALGSNVGHSQQHIAKAVELLGARVKNIVQAPLYTSKAVGYTDQPDFYNTALRGETYLSANELLKFVKHVEQEVGRVYRFRWGPREIDIDIIFYGDMIMEKPDLNIPHLRFAERDFVLRPLVDIDSRVIDPRSGRSVGALLAALPADSLSVQSKTND